MNDFRCSSCMRRKDLKNKSSVGTKGGKPLCKICSNRITANQTSKDEAARIKQTRCKSSKDSYSSGMAGNFFSKMKGI
jgi:hypothetical protein